MKKSEFLDALQEKVRTARANGKNKKGRKELFEATKEELVSCIQEHWLNSIPSVLETEGSVRVSARIILGKNKYNYYGFESSKGSLVFTTLVEAEGFMKDIANELAEIVEHDVQYDYEFGHGYIRAEYFFYY